MTSWYGNVFRFTGPLWGESTGNWWTPITKGWHRGALMFSWNKKWSCRWFETPRRSCDVAVMFTSRGQGQVKRGTFNTRNPQITYTVTRWAVICAYFTFQWRHNERDGVSNHQPHHYLLNRLFRHRAKKTSKLRVIGICEGNTPVTGEVHTQRVRNAENVSIWWRHHEHFWLSEYTKTKSIHGVWYPDCLRRYVFSKHGIDHIKKVLVCESFFNILRHCSMKKIRKL